MDRLREAELFLLDMDGTLYLGDTVLEGAVEFIRSLESSGRRYIYLTNNSSRAGADYIPRLQALGFPCEQENVFSSGMAAAEYLLEHFPGQGVYPVGTARFETELESYGITLTEDSPAAVVVGFDRELTYDKLEKAVHHLRRGAAFIAANPDLVCPMPAGEVLPDCGSICALLTAATGTEPYYIGKPNQAMIDVIAKKTGLPNGRIAVVGDRLYTDIAVGINAGSVSVLVLSGETSQEMLEKSDVRPDYVFPSVKELGEALQ